MRIFLMAVLFVTAPLSALAQDGGGRWQEGVHYYEIDQQAPVGGDKVVVEEVFSYACPHCNNFQPVIDPWHKKLPADVEFKRLPAIFNRSWEPYARAYYTIDAMGVAEDTHQAIFDALHRDHKPLRSIEDIANFVSTLGVDKKTFMSTAESFAVNGRLNQSQTQVRRYGITGTPSIVVDGKYRIAAGKAVKTYDEMLQVADYLINKQRQSRSAMAAN